jgi:hypothetical protein
MREILNRHGIEVAISVPAGTEYEKVRGLAPETASDRERRMAELWVRVAEQAAKEDTLPQQLRPKKDTWLELDGAPEALAEAANAALQSSGVSKTGIGSRDASLSSRKVHRPSAGDAKQRGIGQKLKRGTKRTQNHRKRTKKHVK